ncbi:hypothetical protein O3M35_008373 [Rhynocoris fuscipes]|uniref:Uncharacterized protein n=1 Tax=Rhynocoris fuscipes TaxID=488301 RepID=A0AAW1D6P8_9HEMI
MGGQQSTRRISIDNDIDPASVIKVSEAVVERLRGGTEPIDEQEQEDEASQPPPPQKNVIEAEVEKNTEYWERRLADLQDTHEQMNKIMEEEYVKAQEDIAEFLPRIISPNSPLPCQDGKAKVTSCYKAHPKQSLNCAAEVEQFASCLINTRIKLQEEGKI